MESITQTADLVGVFTGLLLIAAATLAISKILRIPFTVLLVLVGILITHFSTYGLPFLQLIADYHISPEVILFVFLPTLIFESAFNLDARQLRDNLLPVLALAIPGLLFSTALIGLLVWLLTGLAIPLTAALLLGAILSATDPVAVISIFKQLGAPKRLTVLVEGESLFNDATSLVVSKILVGVVLAGTVTWGEAADGILEFFVVFFGGVLVGWLLAYITGWLLGLVESDPAIEISLTTILAYFSFLIAEEMFHVSGVMAVVAAGVTMGGRGRAKISPSVAGYLHHFWEYLAYVANALIFLLVGMRMELGALVDNIWLLTIVVIAMLISRACVVYSVVPILGKLPNSKPIERNYQHVMYWGGLRGAIALAIVLSLPEFPYSDVFVTLVAGAVLFTLIFQGLTIEGLVRKLGLNKPPLSDRLARSEGLMDAKKRALGRIPELQAGGLFSARIAGTLEKYYQQQMLELERELSQLRKKELDEEQERRLIMLRCFAAEKTLYYQMYGKGHLSERAYRDLDHSIDIQSDGMRHDGRLPHFTLHPPLGNTVLEKLAKVRDVLLGFTGLPERLQLARTARDYEEAWGRHQGSDTILQELNNIASSETSRTDIVEEIRKVYAHWRQSSRNLIDATAEQFPEFVSVMQERLARRLALHAEREAIEEEARAGTIPSGVAEKMVEAYTHEIRTLRGHAASALKVDPSELLRKVPFFADTPPHEFEIIAALLKPRTIPASNLIIRQGDIGDSLFLIARGVVRVVREHNGEEQDLATLLAGDFFGEMALLHGERRNASCRAVTPCALYELKRNDFEKACQTNPAMREALEATYQERAAT
ncbi:MAG: hypothetical protein BMS9Abin15_0859 [Gammaproteobacteria bacterium]|nr:MAG: hypothetical protein BMS9Abin15_0859 [Gammaproteobacteria bacterium]